MYFGSGPTKKDAKFACGSVAWANIEVTLYKIGRLSEPAKGRL